MRARRVDYFDRRGARGGFVSGRHNGCEAAQRIREQPWGKSIVRVALTGWGREEDRRKSSEAGFDNHLVQPVDYSTFLKMIAELQ